MGFDFSRLFDLPDKPNYGNEWIIKHDPITRENGVEDYFYPQPPGPPLEPGHATGQGPGIGGGAPWWLAVSPQDRMNIPVWQFGNQYRTSPQGPEMFDEAGVSGGFTPGGPLQAGIAGPGPVAPPVPQRADLNVPTPMQTTPEQQQFMQQLIAQYGGNTAINPLMMQNIDPAKLFANIGQPGSGPLPMYTPPPPPVAPNIAPGDSSGSGGW